jgi:hypothetical protein
VRRLLAGLAAASLALTAAAALPPPQRGAAKADAKEQPVGAAARAKHGPEPLARPPADAGGAEDPAPIAAPSAGQGKDANAPHSPQ